MLTVKREELNRLNYEVTQIISGNPHSHVKETNAPDNEKEINYIEDLVSGKTYLIPQDLSGMTYPDKGITRVGADADETISMKIGKCFHNCRQNNCL